MLHDSLIISSVYKYSISMKRFVFFIALSILFHFLSWDINSRLYNWFGQKEVKPKKETIEVTLETPDENKEEKKNLKIQPLVRYTDPPKELLDLSPESLKKKAEFSSDRVQRVLEESKAAQTGKTQNRQQTQNEKNLNNKTTSYNKKINPMLNPHKWVINDFNNSETSKNEPQKQQNDLSPSTIGEYISDNVKVGDFTALNTDRNMFYSFFTRIEDAVRPKWESEVEDTLALLQKSNLHISQKQFKTRIDILLTSDGKYYKAVLLKSSGVHGLDQAIINAFKEAQFFPHPPQEMIGSDGLIKLEYVFHVEYNPQVLSSNHSH